MTGKLGLTTAVALLAALTIGRQAGAAPDPVNCTGYPEPRIYLENQSWWESQPGVSSHPGTGKQGHIHVGMCFPLYQTVSGSTMRLDVTFKLHNMPGKPGRPIVRAYGDAAMVDQPTIPPCLLADCEHVRSYEFPLSILRYRGWREFQVILPVANLNASGVLISKQYNVNPWYLVFDVPEPDAPPGSVGTNVADLIGDTWFSEMIGKYSAVRLERSSIPWDEQTGQLTPLSGTWTPKIAWEKYDGFAYIDPAFHATPPSKGTIILEEHVATLGYHTRTLSIDITQLSDGLHRLVIGGGNPSAIGTNTGVLVVPFLVENA